MLYHRWREIAREFRNEIALIDFDSGRKWSFAALARAAETRAVSSSPRVFPQGTTAAFIIEVLQGWRTSAAVCALEPGQAPPISQPLPEGCVHLKSTSATTGPPRWVAMTAEQLAADAEQIVRTMGLHRDWPNFGAISLAHSYGFSNLVLPLLLHGVPLILASSALPEALRRAGSLGTLITLPAVPALWRAWLEADAIPGNVRLAVSAGAPLPLPLERAVFERHGLKIHNFYGASECGGIAFDSTPAPRTDAACVGAAIQNVNVFLNEGCLWVRGPAVGLTYWPEPASNLEDGCYRSSDLARIEGGLIFLEGRKSEEINVAGRKVSPEAIERVLSTHSAVRECLVFGVPSPDASRAESIAVCVVVRTPTRPEVLRQHLLSHLPAWQLPRDWWFVPNLRADSRGKVSRSQWRAQYLKQKGPPSLGGDTPVNLD